jgi:hypothetical protein
MREKMQMFVTVCCIKSLKSRDLFFRVFRQEMKERLKNVLPQGNLIIISFPFHFTHSRLKFLGMFIHTVALYIFFYISSLKREKFKLKLML